MEYDSTLTIVSKSIEDSRNAFNVLYKRHKSVVAHVRRKIVSYDEPERGIVCVKAIGIYFWTPDDHECDSVMREIARILGEDGFAILILNNSVSPDYIDYKVTTPDGFCESVFDAEDDGDAYKIITASYDKELVDLYRDCKIKGDEAFWMDDCRKDPPEPYKKDPPRTQKQILEDQINYIKFEDVKDFKDLLSNKKDLSSVYNKLSKFFNELKTHNDILEKRVQYIVSKDKEFSDDVLYENVTLRTRLEKAEKFSFYGKVFYIHNSTEEFRDALKKIDPQIDEMLCDFEEDIFLDLPLAIARRGGIIEHIGAKFADCCIMIDNEHWRSGIFYDREKSAIRDYKLELISRIAIWYAIINTPELSKEQMKALKSKSFYLESVEARINKMIEQDEERIRQFDAAKQKEFEEIVKSLKSKYSEIKASTLNQIGQEMEFDAFYHFFSWSRFKAYISEKYGIYPSEYFKKEGILKDKDMPKKIEQEQRAREKAEQEQARQLAKREAIEKKEEAKKIREAAKLEAQRIANEAREKKQEELRQARENAIILYTPGNEPERIHYRIQTLLAKLDKAYPDHVISHLGRDHSNWQDTITELYRLLGYADNRSFLEAYGFRVDVNKGGKTATDADAVINELKRRYPNGTNSMTFAELKAENPDLPLKTLSNNSSKVFGMPFTRYLKENGILG